jgi:hypothetical protein
VLWKCFLRFGGTVVAGLLGLGALYFSFLCNGASFDNRVPKVMHGRLLALTAGGLTLLGAVQGILLIRSWVK